MPVKVSICIPTYNQTEFLRKNLESVVAQTYTDFEIIITDDSDDDAVEIFVKEFLSQHKCLFQYHRNMPALGSPANWNKGLSLAKGEFIKIMHHDDWFKNENSLDGFVKALDQNPNADFAFSVSSIYNVSQNTFSENRPDESFLQQLKEDPLVLFNDNRIGAPTATIFRRSVNLFFDTNISYLVDLEFYIRMLQQNKNYVFINEPLIVNTSNHAGQVTAQFSDSIKQVGEYCYLYNKLFKGKFPQKKYRVFFKSLFFWRRLNSFKELSAMNYPMPQPFWIFRYLLMRANIKRHSQKVN